MFKLIHLLSSAILLATFTQISTAQTDLFIKNPFEIFIGIESQSSTKNNARIPVVVKDEGEVEETEPEVNFRSVKSNAKVDQQTIRSSQPSSRYPVAVAQDAVPIESKLASFEGELNFDTFCDKFKSVELFTQLAATIKRADEELGLPAFLDYTSSSQTEMNWNRKALVQFTLNQLEPVYLRRPFTATEFEATLFKSVTSCLRTLKNNKDHRLFVLISWFEVGSQNGGEFRSWLLSKEVSGKYKNLFDAYAGFGEHLRQQNKLQKEIVLKNQIFTLGADGTPVKSSSNNNQKPIRLNGYLFNSNVKIPDADLNTHAYNGAIRSLIDWNKKNGIDVFSSFNHEGIKLSIAALSVNNGPSAIAATYGLYLKDKIQFIDNKIISFKNKIANEQIAQNRQIVIDKKNELLKKEEKEEKERAKILVLNHPIRKEKIKSCENKIEELKRTKLPSSLDALKLCTCAFDLTVSEHQWTVKQLNIIQSASTKKQKDLTTDEFKYTSLMQSTFSMAMDNCYNEMRK